MRIRHVLFAIALAAVQAARPAAAGVVEETIDLPVQAADVTGLVKRQSIKVTIFRDDTRAKAPFVVLNHGRSGDAQIRARTSPAAFAANARWLVEKGFVVLVPVRIGYGASGGPDVEDSGPCAAKIYRPVYEAAVRQSIAVIGYARKLPYVEADKGVVMGQSFGGTAAIGLAARKMPGILAAVNFAGGGGGRPNSHPGQPCGIDRMAELFASYGSSARIPTLWLYSVNDRYWGPSIPRQWHAAFTASGGKGEFIELPAFRADGHPSFTANPAAWRPALEAFLRSCCGFKTADAGAGPADAASADTPAAFSQALGRWAVKHKVARAVIVVRREGKVVHKGAVGGADPEVPVLLASLSKAITGACVATLVRDGRLGLDWPLSKALARFIAAHGQPGDPRIGRITIAQLLTHRAGFPSGQDGEDWSIRSLLDGYLERHSIRDAPAPAYLAKVLERGIIRDPGAAFAYSNANYLALGAVIEEAAGKSYESYCREAVLVPAGAAGVLDPAWRVMWAYGGWRMRGSDYLAFLDTLDPARSAYGSAVHAWMLDRTDKTMRASNPQEWYGPGVRLRDTGTGLDIWHTGSWRRRLPPDDKGPRSAETSTLAVRAADGTSWFVHSTPLVLDGARAELAQELSRAHQVARRWP